MEMSEHTQQQIQQATMIAEAIIDAFDRRFDKINDESLPVILDSIRKALSYYLKAVPDRLRERVLAYLIDDIYTSLDMGKKGKPKGMI